MIASSRVDGQGGWLCLAARSFISAAPGFS
jgi:hypothetical protein